MQVTDGGEVDGWVDLWTHGWINILCKHSVCGYMCALNVPLHFSTYIKVKGYHFSSLNHSLTFESLRILSGGQYRSEG